jgi:predicted TIM-barrel fold metal-dependent hydrolase
MSEGWQEYLGRPGSLPSGGGVMPVLPEFPYHHPMGDKLAGSFPERGAPGSDYDVLRTQVFDGTGVAKAVLSHDRGMWTPSLPNPHLATEISRAINNWTVDSWLERGDDRLYGLVMVPNQLPEQGAAEIRRAGIHSRMVGALMCANGVGKLFGHPLYHPIYEAAAEMDLPIVVHGGGDALMDSLTHPAGGGLPMTYGEFAALAPSPLMGHLFSLIVQGVFEKYPDLRVVIVGGGTAWLPMLWRLDTDYQALRREAPWLRRWPSEYFREHVWVSTYPLEQPGLRGDLVRLLKAIDGIEDRLVYASGYPDTNSDSVARVSSLLPSAWHDRVFYENANRLFRWDHTKRNVVRVPEVEVGAMLATGSNELETSLRGKEGSFDEPSVWLTESND